MIMDKVLELETLHARSIRRAKLIIFFLCSIICMNIIQGLHAITTTRNDGDDWIVVRNVRARYLEITEPGNDLACSVGFDPRTHDLGLRFKNHKRGVLNMGIRRSGDPYISFLDKHEHIRLDLGLITPINGRSDPQARTDAVGGFISLFGSEKKIGIEFGLPSDDKPFLHLSDRFGQHLASLITSPDDTSVLSLSGASGGRLLQIGTIDPIPTLSIQDERGKRYKFPDVKSN